MPDFQAKRKVGPGILVRSGDASQEALHLPESQAYLFHGRGKMTMGQTIRTIDEIASKLNVTVGSAYKMLSLKSVKAVHGYLDEDVQRAFPGLFSDEPTHST